MKLRTRLLITFLTIIILPLVLTTLAFITIGSALMRTQQEKYGADTIDYTLLSETVQSYGEVTDELFRSLQKQAELDGSKLENKSYLQKAAEVLRGKSAYMVVRKGSDIYFTTNDAAANNILSRLPDYGSKLPEGEIGYYYDDMQNMVKQLDFKFSDGSEGSIFMVTRVNSIISKSLLFDMLIAIILILLFTSSMLTRWIHKGVFEPVRELNIAMQHVANGDLDYTMATRGEGELEENYKMYEAMRLRLKETTEEKVQNDKQNRELISNISHDLKTPITSIKGYVEGIMDGVADTPEKVDKYIKTIYNKANDMDKLINELTLYSGIDSNRIPYNFHKINVADYFRDCVEEVGLDLESKNTELNYSNFVPEETVIIADPEQLKRVINNIIGNSMKYMDKEHGVIDIRILDEAESIRFEIEDNGKGIAAKDLTDIFERFYRTDASRNSSKGGSGIGLSIVRKIVEDHGGYIWATSKEHEGTCLHFVIRKYREVKNHE